jgi:nucleolysin TIA-1/TIAR
MWDMKTGRSRGYGFVAFRERPDAEKALSSMDGEWLGSRAIRCNWANQKGQPSISQQQAMAAIGMTPTTPFGHHHFPTHGVQSYDMVVQQTPQWQTTCYVGNLTPYTTQNDLVPLFQNFGYVVETRFQSDRGFAFVKMDSHENAAMAICQLSGYNVNGRPLKCSVSVISFPRWLTRPRLMISQWGKDRPPTGQFEGYSPQAPASTPDAYSAQPSPYGGFPQYGSPAGPGGPMAPQGRIPTLCLRSSLLISTGPSPGGRGGWDAQQSPYGGPPMPNQGYGQMPGSAGGYGRGQPTPGAGWNQGQGQSHGGFGNGYQGYQG